MATLSLLPQLENGLSLQTLLYSLVIWNVCVCIVYIYVFIFNHRYYQEYTLGTMCIDIVYMDVYILDQLYLYIMYVTNLKIKELWKEKVRKPFLFLTWVPSVTPSDHRVHMHSHAQSH
jgi:hypothetical protein